MVQNAACSSSQDEFHHARMPEGPHDKQVCMICGYETFYHFPNVSSGGLDPFQSCVDTMQQQMSFETLATKFLRHGFLVNDGENVDAFCLLKNGHRIGQRPRS